MSLFEILVFLAALSVPLTMMFVHDFRIARQAGVGVFELPAWFNRYCTLLVLTTVYGGIYYVLLMLYMHGYLDNNQSVNLYGRDDFFVPTACISTLSILLFGYILQADNAFYLASLRSGADQTVARRDLIFRTFRSVSIGQIAPGIFYPLSVSLWALHGAWLYNIYNIVMRASNQDLMPRVFFSGAVRMIAVLFASVLIYAVYQAMFKPYRESDGANSEALVVENRGAASMLVALALLTGFFPIQAVEITWQKLKSSEVMGAVFTPEATLSMSYIQGMNSFMRERLFEEGVVDIHQLATLGKRRDLLHSRIQNLVSDEQLNDWVDQAKLLLLIQQPELLLALRSMGVRGLKQLDQLVKPENSAQVEQLLLQADEKSGLRTFIQGYTLVPGTAEQSAQ
ncbi:MAG: hypothetical protein AUJ57_07560 [Zetaproteobacteria bacterium CG1_02_53_45]|nr:MAG: hypothetical protein AUJ57_07560 [Zetaproteobacteria bacterium CG1_02_53_45]